MSSPHLPGPHGYIIASKLSFLIFLLLWGAELFPIQKINTSISIKPPVQLLNNSLPLFNNLFVNQTNSYQLIPYFEPNSSQMFKPNSFQLIPKPNSFQLIPKPNSYQLIPKPNSFQMLKPNSYQLIPYFEPNSFQMLKPNSFQMLKPNSYQLIPYFEPNSFQMLKPNSFQMLKPNSYQLILYFEPNSFKAIQNNNSIQELHETPLKNNTSEQTVLYLLLSLQENYIDSENKTRENQTNHNNVERNIIMNQINSFLIFSI